MRIVGKVPGLLQSGRSIAHSTASPRPTVRPVLRSAQSPATAKPATLPEFPASYQDREAVTKYRDAVRSYLGPLAQLEEWEEFKARKEGAPWHTLRGFWLGSVVRPFMQTLGRLSFNINEGYYTGHDSGEMLRRVYDNEPKGTTPLGRFIDRLWLESPFWSDARHRQELLKERVIDLGMDLLAAGKSVRIFDPAAGSGTYDLEIVQALRLAASDPTKVTAHLRDWEQSNVGKILENARRMGLANAVTAQQGDAFNVDQVRTARDLGTNIAIVSGFWELYDDNLMVFDSMRAVVEGLVPGGTLVHTGMHWNNMRWFSAMVLKSHRITREFDSDKERDRETRDVAPIRPIIELQRLGRKAGLVPGLVATTENNYFNVCSLHKPAETTAT